MFHRRPRNDYQAMKVRVSILHVKVIAFGKALETWWIPWLPVTCIKLFRSLYIWDIYCRSRRDTQKNGALSGPKSEMIRSEQLCGHTLFSTVSWSSLKERPLEAWSIKEPFGNTKTLHIALHHFLDTGGWQRNWLLFWYSNPSSLHFLSYASRCTPSPMIVHKLFESPL